MKPDKAAMHSAIDRAKMDDKYPVIFIGFNEEGDSSGISFFYGDRSQLIPVLYEALGTVMFQPQQPVLPPDLDSTRVQN